MRIVASRSVALPLGPPREAPPRRSPDAAATTALVVAPAKSHRFAMAQQGTPDAGFVMQLIASAATPPHPPDGSRQMDRSGATAAYGAAGRVAGLPGHRMVRIA